MPVTADLEGGKQLAELSAKLAKAGNKTLITKMRRKIRAEAQATVRDARASVMRVRVTSSQRGKGKQRRHRRPLRATTAKALGVSVTNKRVRIRVSPAAFGNPREGVNLPKLLDSTLPGRKKWRHPVFGNRENWVEQKGQPWFFGPVRKHRLGFQAAVRKAMDETAEELTR